MSGLLNIPRLVVAAPSSGTGKSTVALGLIRALVRSGRKVAVFKCGPDYLDPFWLAKAAGRPCQNLDGWMMGRQAVQRTFALACEGADIALIEGVMGLFDGRQPGSLEGSTAEISLWLDAPVLLTVDVSGMAGSVRALVDGFSGFEKDLSIAGVIANRCGSGRHRQILQDALGEMPVVAALPKSGVPTLPSRHLGLLAPSLESLDILDGLADIFESGADLEKIVSLAQTAPLPTAEVVFSPARPAGVKIGIARDEAFSFYYADNLRRLEDEGAELIEFSPMRDSTLPAVDGLIFGGGYPELHASALSANTSMLLALKAAADSQIPIYAECGGLMYLSEAVVDMQGATWPMAGLVPGVCCMSKKLKGLGYAEVITCTSTLLGPAGTTFRGHQFRYSDIEGVQAGVYEVSSRLGREAVDGYQAKSVLASYIHAHWASNPIIPANIVKACRRVISA